MPVKGVSGCAGRAGELSCDSGFDFTVANVTDQDCWLLVYCNRSTDPLFKVLDELRIARLRMLSTHRCQAVH